MPSGTHYGKKYGGIIGWCLQLAVIHIINFEVTLEEYYKELHIINVLLTHQPQVAT